MRRRTIPAAITGRAAGILAGKTANKRMGHNAAASSWCSCRRFIKTSTKRPADSRASQLLVC
jgi:hypothetical protein